jgi:hypothetical protein
MKRQNKSIVAVIIFVIAVLIIYDSGNAEKRRNIIHKSSMVNESISSVQQMLDRTHELRVRVDELLVTASQAKDLNAKGQEIFSTATQKKSAISAKQEEMKALLGERIREFNKLVDEYNNSPRPIIFGKGDLPKVITKLIKT